MAGDKLCRCMNCGNDFDLKQFICLVCNPTQAHLEPEFEGPEESRPIWRKLTIAERGLVEVLKDGRKQSAIADELGIARDTLRMRTHKIRRKANAKNVQQLLILLIEEKHAAALEAIQPVASD